MKDTIKTLCGVSIACASLVPSAYGIGLGNIVVSSKLNQPFKGRIELIETDSIPLRELKVSRAERSAYERAKLVYSSDLVFLRYQVKGDISRPYIEINSKENVSAPFLNILLKLQWPQGEVYRSYSILLDPPDYTLKEVTTSQRISVQPKARERFVRISRKTKTITVKPEDTIWHIARDIRTHKKGTVHQIAVALFKLNPDAFINQDINLMRTHAVLRLPSKKQIHAISAEKAFALYTQVLEGHPLTKQHAISRKDMAPVPSKHEQMKQTESLMPVPLVKQNEIKVPFQKEETQKPLPEPKSIPEKTQPKQTKQPVLQLDSTEEVEDESNFWFLDTFEPEEIKQDVNQEVKQEVKQEKKTKPQPIVSTPEQKANDEALLRLVDKQNKKLTEYAHSLEILSKQLEELSNSTVSATQASANVEEEDSSWTFFWFLMTLASASTAGYLAYRLYLLSQLKQAEQEEADDHESMVLSSIKQSLMAAQKSPELKPKQPQAPKDIPPVTSPEPVKQPVVEPSVVQVSEPVKQETVSPEVQVNEAAPVQPEKTTKVQEPFKIKKLDDIAPLPKGTHELEFDSSFSGKYQVGRKGDRQDDDLTLDIDLPSEKEQEPKPEPELAAEVIEIDPDVLVEEEPEVEVQPQAASIGTKIDLVTAYITMDDKANARAILAEIMEEGNDEEIKIAQKLLDELDKDGE